MEPEQKTFCEAFKSHRLKLGLSLRQFCQQHGFDPANMSRLERGLLPPPRENKLREYSKALGLVEGSDEWYEFFDLAAAAKGEFPEDLRDDELLKQLPVLFRTMRGEVPSEGQLEHVLKTLRKR